MSTKYIINKEALEQAVKESFSIFEVINKLNFPRNGSLHKRFKEEIKKYNIDASHFTGQRWNKNRNRHNNLRVQGYTKEQIFVENSVVSTRVVRRYIETEPGFDHKCCICNNIEWMGKPIPLELDHINGNNRDNRRENLRFICLNCHAQTHTFRGRNINRKGGKKVSDDVMIDAIKSCYSIREALMKVGLTPKGGNYNRVNELMSLHGIKLNKLSKIEDKKPIHYKLKSLEDIGLTIDKFEELCSSMGLSKIGSMYDVSDRIVKRWCKENNIYHSLEDRANKSRKFEVTKEELEKLVNELPLTQIGKKFDVSNNAIKKRCKLLGIELPKGKIWESSLKALELGRNKMALDSDSQVTTIPI